MIDILIDLIRAVIVLVVAAYIIRLLDSAGRKFLLHIRKIKEGREHHTRMKNDAEQAVRRALSSWNYAENYREVKTDYVQAYGGYYPTVLEEIECWEDVAVKCKNAVTALERINASHRARDFSRNVLLASKKIEALRSHSNGNNTRGMVIGISEAKRREVDAKLATNDCEVLSRIARESQRYWD